jgi:hypothetical protein
MEAKEGQLIRNSKGQFVQGNKGGGRPKGSKNKISILKLEVEETFRERNQDAIDAVLDLIVADALAGDKNARKLIWDSCMSRANVSEDKSAGTKQSITVHRMNVVKSDDVNTNQPEEDENV